VVEFGLVAACGPLAFGEAPGKRRSTPHVPCVASEKRQFPCFLSRDGEIRSVLGFAVRWLQVADETLGLGGRSTR